MLHSLNMLHSTFTSQPDFFFSPRGEENVKCHSSICSWICKSILDNIWVFVYQELLSDQALLTVMYILHLNAQIHPHGYAYVSYLLGQVPSASTFALTSSEQSKTYFRAHGWTLYFDFPLFPLTTQEGKRKLVKNIEHELKDCEQYLDLPREQGIYIPLELLFLCIIH